MDFQQVVDAINGMACILSIEVNDDGSYGTIRIVAANKDYISSVEQPGEDVPQTLEHKFVPDSDYLKYLDRDLNFEHYVYQSAFLKHPMHAYVKPERYDFWFNVFVIPINYEEKGKAYCLYSYEAAKEQNAELMSQVSVETTTRVLNTCIKLHGAKDYNETLNSIIKDIRLVCKASYCCILTMDFVKEECAVICEDKAENTGLVTNDNWFDGFYSIAVTWKDIIGGSNCLIIKDSYDMSLIKEKNYEWYVSLKSASVESMVLMPLKNGSQLIGYIWATNFDTQNAIRIKEILELTSYFLASDIANHQMFDRLKYLSSIDLLTGVYNRNEMNNRVDEFCKEESGEKKPLGVVFADLNGLKFMNDSEGHVAGDLLLKNAAVALQNIFINGEVFRAGGDEFIVLVENVSKKEFERLISQLKKKISIHENGVSFSFGSCYTADSRMIREAMRKADENMYENKRSQFAKENDPKYRPRE